MFLSIFSSYTLIPDISACYLRLGVGVAVYSARVKSLSLPETTRPSQNGRILLLSLRTLCTVLRAALRTVGYTSRIKRTTDDVIAYTREILHTTATNQHDAVLLKVVTLSGDVGVNLLLIGQTHTFYFFIYIYFVYYQRFANRSVSSQKDILPLCNFEVQRYEDFPK